MKLSIQKRSRLSLSLIAGALASLMAAGAVQAQEQSMEERLRAQLRSVTGQLQQVQNELAQMKATGGAVPAAKPAPASDAEALRAELAQSRQQLGREREARNRRDAEVLAAQQQAKEATDKANAQVLQFRGAYD